MIIVPGVPLINGVQDMIRNHMTLAISRLGFAGLVTTAIAFGLFVATVLTGVTIPVEAPARAIGIPEDAVFSALAALGYAFLFNVPARVAWACVVCGVASHTTRTLCVHLGIDIIAGTLIGALAAGSWRRPSHGIFMRPPPRSPFPASSPWCLAPTLSEPPSASFRSRTTAPFSRWWRRRCRWPSRSF